jgi:2-polyprenyl-6-methoxyphenol hydroxylase-like FAD-dependent oxidoreductase
MTGTIPVLVVGAGPVGLSAALLLARQRVACVIVERHHSTSHHPKARGVRIRTMELFRQWGLEGQLRGNALPAEGRRFIYCETLAGREIGRSPEIVDSDDQFSPTTSCRVAQDTVERTLIEQVRADPLIDLRMGTRLVDLVQDDDGVTATLVSDAGDDGVAASFATESTVRAEFVIAADGVGSTVRGLLKIALDGPAVLAYWQSIYWHGDISVWTAERPCIQFFTGAKAGTPATVASVDGAHRWVTMVTLPPSDAPPAPLDESTARNIVRRAVGDDALDVEVVDIATWRLSSQVAATWRDRRIFLAGDAAHSFPPTGGFGMNTGVQDVHNLVWKLALVLQEKAGPSLLGTYAQERKPLAKANADWSVANSGRFREINAAIVAEDDSRLARLISDQKEHVLALGQDLGFDYASAAVLPDGTPSPQTTAGEFVPVARPGRRAPHVWVFRDGERISTLDLFDDRFVLLTGADGQAWCSAAAELSSKDAPPVRAYRVGAHGDVIAGGDFEAVYCIGNEGAALVRPDGHVAWRTRQPPTGASDLAEILRKLLR